MRHLTGPTMAALLLVVLRGPAAAGEPPAGDGGAADPRQAHCDGGDAAACANMGHDLLTGQGARKDPVRALPLLERACEAGKAEACNNAGVIYGNGMGTAKDVPKSLARYERACELRDLFCFNLGQAYDRGLGRPKDPAKAAELFGRCCTGGGGPCCTNLGVRTLKGLGVVVDSAKAAALFLEGCRHNDELACQDLGQLCDTEPKTIAEVLGRAADGGDAVASLLLGWFHREGRGLKKDLTRARTLFDAACKDGLKEGCKELEQLGGASKP
jgi:TPR repeat protein